MVQSPRLGFCVVLLAVFGPLGCSPKSNGPGSNDPGAPSGSGGSGGVSGSGGASAGVTGGAPAGGSGGSASEPSAGNAGGGAPAGGAGGGAGGSNGGPDAAPGPAAGQVVVRAGELERDHAIVSFPLPGQAGKNLILRAADGTELPLQVAQDGTATFVLPSLSAGAEARFTLEQPAAPPPAAITTAESENPAGIAVRVDDRQVLHFQTRGQRPNGVPTNRERGGYIHPVFTPSGTLVSDDYPSDHLHHHGIWSAWTSAQWKGASVDFWNMQGNSAKVDFDSLGGTWQGPVHAGFSAKLLHTALRPATEVALNEQWVVTVYKTHPADPPYFVFDLHSTQEAASATPLRLNTYHYGGFAIRGHAQWRNPSNATYLTSEGDNRGSGDGKRAHWSFIGGNVDGKAAGYAILGHPTNFRAPQGLRHNPTDPFIAILPATQSAGGAFDIEPGKPYISRFRFVTTDGPPNAQLLDRIWKDFATPAEVTVR